jgi:nucleotidyltransferase/DNA polymerase involved in DNA repair
MKKTDAQKIKELRRKIKTLKSHLVRAQGDYLGQLAKADELNRKYGIAIDRLHSIAAGFAPSDMEKYELVSRLQLSASRTLKELAK